MNKLRQKFKDNLLGQLSDEKTEVDINIACRITEDFTLSFYKWMRVQDSPLNAERWLGYDDRDMIEYFKNDVYE